MSNLDQKTCDNCGSLGGVNDVFCRHCGKPFTTPLSEETHLATPLLEPIGKLEQRPTQPRLDNLPLTVYLPQRASQPQSNSIYLILIIALVVMLIGAGVIVGILVGRGNPQVIIVATPTSVPTPTLTQLIPTSTTPSDTLLYQDSGSDNWQGWNTTLGWNIVGGMLTDDGMHTSSILGPQIVAPFQVPVQDYAVEVTVQVVSSTQRCFGITIRGTSITNSWRGYQGSVNLNGGCEYNNGLGILNDVAPSLGYIPFNVDYAWHTYRLEVKGDTISFSVDSGPSVHAIDSRVSSGGQVGLWSVFVKLNVSSIKIIAL